jgi:hypothetical protein
LSSRSHCGGMEKLNLPFVNPIREIGRALPPPPTKRPTSVRVPERCTSSQEGTSLPGSCTVISQRPSMAYTVSTFFGLVMKGVLVGACAGFVRTFMAVMPAELTRAIGMAANKNNVAMRVFLSMIHFIEG